MISANVLEVPNLETTQPEDRIGGVGGVIDSVAVRTQVRLTRDDDQKTVFRGDDAACRYPEALDMSVLGRDVLDLFVVIVDRRAEIVAIIGGQHRYTIQRR